MIPGQFVVDMINQLVAATNTLWGSIAPDSKMVLIATPFIPNPGLLVTDFTEATFTGSDPILVPLGPQDIILDNNSGRVGIALNEPVGGYKWICTAAPAAPEIIYGWAILDSAGDNVYFSDVFPTPITINAIGNFVEATSVLGYEQLEPYGNV